MHYPLLLLSDPNNVIWLTLTQTLIFSRYVNPNLRWKRAKTTTAVQESFLFQTAVLFLSSDPYMH